jgi:hypothetical protein
LEGFIFPWQNKKQETSFVPKSLPSDDAINNLMFYFLVTVRIIFKIRNLSFKLSFTDNFEIPNDLQINILWKHFEIQDVFEENTADNELDGIDDDDVVDEERELDFAPENVNSSNNNQRDDEINFLLDQVSDDATFINNISDMLDLMCEDFEFSEEILKEIIDPDTPDRFLVFQRGDKKYYIKKSTILWMLTLKQHKVPNDRIHRFISTSSKRNVQQNLQSGDFVMMQIEREEKICFVQGFVRKSAIRSKKQQQKNNTSSVNNVLNLSSIQLKYGLENVLNNNFLISCQIYQVVDGFLEPGHVQATLIESRHYKNHIYVKRDILTNKISML